VADVTGDPHPEIFVVDASTQQLLALTFVSGNLQVMWKLAALPYSSVAVAKIPGSTSWIVCGLADISSVFCADAANGNVAFSAYISVDLEYHGVYGTHSGVAIERLYQSDPDTLYILTPSKIHYFNSAWGFASLTDITFSGYMEIPFAIDLD